MIKHKRLTEPAWCEHYCDIIETCKNRNIFLECNQPDVIDKDFIHIKGIGGSIVDKVDALLIALKNVDRKGFDLDSRLKNYGIAKSCHDKIKEDRNNLLSILSEPFRKEWNEIYRLSFEYGCGLRNLPGIYSG